MKSIFVQNIQETGKYYSVALGDGTRHEFTNLKKAKAFQVKTNNFLTAELHKLNSIYSDLFTIYRNLWGYFYHSKNTTISNNFLTEQQIKESFNSIDSMLELATTSSSRQSDYYRIYRDFEIIIFEIKQICSALSFEISTKSQSILSLKINYIVEQANQISHNVKSFSHADLKHKITTDPLFAAIRYATNSKTA